MSRRVKPKRGRPVTRRTCDSCPNKGWTTVNKILDNIGKYFINLTLRGF